MSKEKVTGTVKLWLTSEDKVAAYLNAKTPDEKATTLHPHNGQDMTAYGWLLVAEGQITFTEPSRELLVDRQADAIRAQIQQEKADSYKRLMGLEDKLNQLLAISCEVQP